MAFRSDSGSLKSPEMISGGRMRVEGHLTRTGVFTYRNTDGSVRREYRPDAEVFKAESLATFADAPVTNEHPLELVTAENARQLAVGHVSGAPRRDGDYVAATLVIDDATTIAEVKAGKAELSNGYETDLDPTPGFAPDGQRYDAVQTNIRGNHVAIVSNARAGRSARMRLDSAEQIRDQEHSMDPKEFAKALLDAATATARADAADKSLAEAKAAHAAELAAAQGRADVAEKSLAAEKQSRVDGVAVEGAKIRARIELEQVAAKVLPAETKFDGLTDRQVRTAVVKHLDGAEPAADAHDEYVRAVFEGAVKRAQAESDAHATISTAIVASRTDGGDASKAHAEMVERNRNLWSTK